MRALVPLLLATAILAAQAPLLDNLDNFTAPEQDLGSLSREQFTTFSHHAFPKHTVRIKQLKDLCDNKSKSYSGYIDVEARHLFFYFFESRTSPDDDPVVMWINGGPGCSSSLGAFMGLGLCNIHDNHGPKFNPHAWNTKANVFFLDQPVGVGFSYTSHGESVSTTEDAALDVTAFINIFFESFHKFKSRAGHYLPIFASYLCDSNAVAVAEGREPISISSILIGNGVADIEIQFPSFYRMASTADSGVKPVLSIQACVRMKQALPRCQMWFRESCVDSLDAIACNAALKFCETEIFFPFLASGINPLNIAVPCDGSLETTGCYPVMGHIEKWLDRPEARAMLGVSQQIGNFSSCSDAIGFAFDKNLDVVRPAKAYVAGLLERGIPVLVYAGNYDWRCSWLDNLAWANALEWNHGAKFAAQPLKEWTVGGERAGQTKSIGGLTYATVDGAGHMVPYDRPEQALAMLNRWLAGEEL